MLGRNCLACHKYRILWASSATCAVCALEWSFNKRKLSQKTILEIISEDKKLFAPSPKEEKQPTPSSSELLKKKREKDVGDTAPLCFSTDSPYPKEQKICGQPFLQC